MELLKKTPLIQLKRSFINYPYLPLSILYYRPETYTLTTQSPGLKLELSFLFIFSLFFWWIRNNNSVSGFRQMFWIYADPDPQHWFSLLLSSFFFRHISSTSIKTRIFVQWSQSLLSSYEYLSWKSQEGKISQKSSSSWKSRTFKKSKLSIFWSWPL